MLTFVQNFAVANSLRVAYNRISDFVQFYLNKLDFLGGYAIMKILIPCEGSKISQDIGSCKEFLLVEAEEGKVTNTSSISAPGTGISSLFGLFTKIEADAMICGDVSRRAKNTIMMLGMELTPGCEGEALEAVEKYLKGEELGNLELLEDPESEYSEDDPMACMHDCEKCTMECHTNIKDLAEMQRNLEASKGLKS
jgi:predicted Fe-Mo cluster-binding NifX family protein